jgi:putative PEP-CTERM system histidine kinase
MLLGGDSSGRPYAEDDFDLIRALSSQAATQVKNLRLAGEVMAIRDMEVFSRTSAFVMHDLKNLTNSLSLVSQNAKDNLENIEFQKDAVRTIDTTVARMKRLIGKLSEVPEAVDAKRSATGVDSIVGAALKKLAFTDAKAVEIKMDIPKLPDICVDPEAMEMVLINLIANAYDAISGKGEIRISASLNSTKVYIDISDTGRGMTREFVEKDLFRPFSTTKKGGLGIGLFQCRSIVEAHNGSIEVRSSEGKGTTFRVSLPADNLRA